MEYIFIGLLGHAETLTA